MVIDGLDIVLQGLWAGYLALFPAIFAKMLQNLCKSVEYEEYGITPLSNLHKKIALKLKKKGMRVLLKLHYCFICQSFWYACFFSAILAVFGAKLFFWQHLSIPPLAYLIASYIIKNEYFETVFIEEEDE